MSPSRVENGEPSLGTIFYLVLLGAFAGAALTFRFIASDNSSVISKDLESSDDDYDTDTDTIENESESDNNNNHDEIDQNCYEDGIRCSCDAKSRKERLPLLVILVRHGESEGNVDKKMWWKKPDHTIELTEKGKQQASDAGKRIEAIFRACDNEDEDEEEEANNSATHDDGTTTQRRKRRRRRRIRNVHLHVSPFERTTQTARLARPFFEHRVRAYKLCPRLREQEFGNIQNAAFYEYRAEQKKVGRFWYRFPTGESGADVLDRVKSWWMNDLLQTNEEPLLEGQHYPQQQQPNDTDTNRDGEEGENDDDSIRPGDGDVNVDVDGDGSEDEFGDLHCDAVVVFSHGLTVRLIMCQLFTWSISTFHSVYNANNCDLYVLRRDLDKRGDSPYVLDGFHGELPQSSIDVKVAVCCKKETTGSSNVEDCHQKNDNDNNNGTTHKLEKVYKLKDYLSLPPPRMTHIDEVKTKLAEQYPEDFSGGPDDIESISFVPFSLYEPQQQQQKPATGS